MGVSTTSAPSRFIKTSVPSNRKALGRRTAWLPPCRNSFATAIATFCIHTSCSVKLPQFFGMVVRGEGLV